MKQCLILFALAAAVLGCDEAHPIVENGRSDWKIVRMDGDDLLCDRVYLVDKGMP